MTCKMHLFSSPLLINLKARLNKSRLKVKQFLKACLNNLIDLFLNNNLLNNNSNHLVNRLLLEELLLNLNRLNPKN